jgi:hypothetical protein
MSAAKGGSLDVLAYLQQQDDIEFDAWILTLMLNIAGAHNKLSSCKMVKVARRRVT